METDNLKQYREDETKSSTSRKDEARSYLPREDLTQYYRVINALNKIDPAWPI